jgi:oligopeptidase A
MSNPLLVDTPNALPAFDLIAPEHAEAALDAVLAQNRTELNTLLEHNTAPTWDSLIEPLEEMGDRISHCWGPVQHLFGVNSTTPWRKAFNACLPKLTEYGLELSLSEPLYRAYKTLAESPAFGSFSASRKKVVNDALRDFKLSGIALPKEKQDRFKAIAMRLSELQSKFEENLMDSIQAWSKQVTDEALLDGMTDAAKQAAREKAQAKNLEGWLLTLDFPSYDAVITYAKQRELRRELYEAYATRASDQGPLAGQHDNTPLMSEILALRDEEAKLLGFNNFAELSLATKMAESPAEVETFLLDLARRAKPSAQVELEELKAYAKKLDGLADFQPWDSPYYAEKYKEEKLGLAEEELRPYFPAAQTISGMFDVVQKLYGISIEKTEGIATWHADVTTYTLKDAAGKSFGLFYLDPYARADKRGGAWMDECLVRRRTAQGLQLPVAYLTGNFTPPLRGGDTASSRSEAGAGAEPTAPIAGTHASHAASGAADKPALLTHDEVVTLFHEFGHGLHHLLTRVEEAAVSGIRGVAWDAVELPSQFMENWCYDRDTLRQLARHWQTGQPLPEEFITKLKQSRSFLSGLGTLRQIEFSLFDLRLHLNPAPHPIPLPEGEGGNNPSPSGRVRGISQSALNGTLAPRTREAPDEGARSHILETLDNVRSEVAVFTPPAFNRMPNSFSHVFAGGYAAGYYSYKWAEVLSADAFAAFEESGFAPETGARFRDTVLAQGGSREAMDLFVEFRGRKPSIEPLLRQSGLLDAA